MQDRYKREIDYMRVSITDRCNLRCRYCMPDEIPPVPREDILSCEELTAVCGAAAETGIRKLKITGGEPLVRCGCPDLIGRLKQLPGIEQVTMTTNGVLLRQYVDELVKNGLDAVNISLDTLDAEKYKLITGRDELPRVREGIDAALTAGLPVKINVVLQRGVNDAEWRSLAGLAKERQLHVRFIELMPIGEGRGYLTVSNQELLTQMRETFGELQPEHRILGNGPAVYYHIPGFLGSIGLISAMHGKFCDSCNRIRLTAQGKLKPCLCYQDEVDVRDILRSGAREPQIRAELKEQIESAIQRKPGAHCFEHRARVTESRRMAQIGG